MVLIRYSHHTEDREFVNYTADTDHFDEACKILDRYPWRQEIAIFEELGEGGGLDFVMGNEQGKHAYYQLIPIEEGKGFLFLTVVVKTGLFNLLGRQSLNRDFHLVTIETARFYIKELFEHSVESLYEMHRPFKTF
ncbi:hypothetical protein SAMN05421848_3018 [Kushneria avicenniae]|uniref:Uncharacterized protein n=1 Tax=Kushneria avicenniae TaxID=402385 RepID=A0A1I1MTL0_9GAMM|nr:hypothetical protein [Kushneria avicenniae]SFC85923.1 hypothetical protein SAMN05421848_3018 [Kushneria avicenniae]